MTNRKLKELVDTLGYVKAKISQLKEQEAVCKRKLLESGVDLVEGSLFRATVVHSQFQCVDYQGLIEKLKPSTRVLQRYTDTRDRTSVRVVSKRS